MAQWRRIVVAMTWEVAVEPLDHDFGRLPAGESVEHAWDPERNQTACGKDGAGLTVKGGTFPSRDRPACVACTEDAGLDPAGDTGTAS
jgi:hypothetical protein